MEATIRSFFGVDRADISVAPIALLAGHNAASKSSILAGLGCALTGEVLPGGMLKKDAKLAVRDGADSGRVTVKGANGEVSMRWPAADANAEGIAPRATPIAAGLTSLLDMSSAQRALSLAQYLKSDPTQQDLAFAIRDSDMKVPGSGLATDEEAPAMKPLGLDPQDNRDTAVYRLIQKIWPEIEVNGFDGAHKKAQEIGAELKGRWRQVTGETYGSAKAESWTPKDIDLVEALIDVNSSKGDLVQLEEHLVHVKNVRDGVVRNASLHAAGLDQLRALAESVPQRKEAHRQAKADLDAKNAAHTEILVKKPAAPVARPMECPHCSGFVAIENGKLVQVSHAPSPEQIEKSDAEWADWNTREAAARSAMEEAAGAERTAQQALTEAEVAAKKLADGKASGAVPVATQEDVELGNKDVDRAERALLAAKKRREATTLHRQVVLNQALVDLLAPNGLRKQKLARVLDSFNETRLLPLCNLARWKAVTIRADDLEVMFGAKPAKEPYSSESQVMRARIILQLAMAQLDKSDVVLIDRADKLDMKGRDGLFGLLMKAGVPAVVAMTLNKPTPAKPNTVPDLAAFKAGNSYWIEDGIARPLGDLLAEFTNQAAAE